MKPKLVDNEKKYKCRLIFILLDEFFFLSLSRKYGYFNCKTQFVSKKELFSYFLIGGRILVGNERKIN